MKKMFLYFGKRAVVKTLNEALMKNKDNVLRVSAIISIWIERLERIIQALKSLNVRFSDGHLTDDELKESTDDINELIRNF